MKMIELDIFHIYLYFPYIEFLYKFATIWVRRLNWIYLATPIGNKMNCTTNGLKPSIMRPKSVEERDSLLIRNGGSLKRGAPLLVLADPVSFTVITARSVITSPECCFQEKGQVLLDKDWFWSVAPVCVECWYWFSE